jgi:hypothetical protein
MTVSTIDRFLSNLFSSSELGVIFCLRRAMRRNHREDNRFASGSEPYSGIEKHWHISKEKIKTKAKGGKLW